MRTLHEFFIYELRTLLSAAGHMHDMLKRMSSAATSSEVVELFDTYYFQTEYQQKKLKEYLASSTGSEEVDCFAMQRLSDEGQFSQHYSGSSTVRDVVLLITAHKMKHLEMSLVRTARHHADVLKADEGIEMLDAVKKKIAEEEERALDLVKYLLKQDKSPDVKREVEHLLELLICTHSKEEDKLAQFVSELTLRVQSATLGDALQTYLDKHQGVDQYLNTLVTQFEHPEIVPEWEALNSYIKDCNLAADKAEGSLQDLAILCGLRRIQHLNIALFEVEEKLMGYTSHSKMKDRIHTILGHEIGHNESFASIAGGSLLKEGLDSNVQQ